MNIACGKTLWDMAARSDKDLRIALELYHGYDAFWHELEARFLTFLHGEIAKKLARFKNEGMLLDWELQQKDYEWKAEDMTNGEDICLSIKKRSMEICIYREGNTEFYFSVYGVTDDLERYLHILRSEGYVFVRAKVGGYIWMRLKPPYTYWNDPEAVQGMAAALRETDRDPAFAEHFIYQLFDIAKKLE